MKYSLIAATLLVVSTFAGAQQQPYRNYAEEALERQQQQQQEMQREQREQQQRQQEQMLENERQREAQNRPMCTTYHRDPISGNTTAVTQPCNVF